MSCVLDERVGAHVLEDRERVREVVGAEPGTGVDSPAVERAGQGDRHPRLGDVEQARESGGGADELGGPVGDVAEGGARSELRFELGLELEHPFLRLSAERQGGWRLEPVEVDDDAGESLAVGVGDVGGRRRRPDAASSDGVGREREEDPREQPATAETGQPCDVE